MYGAGEALSLDRVARLYRLKPGVTNRVARLVDLTLPRLDPQHKITYRDFLIGLNVGAFFARQFAPADQRGIATLRRQPVTPVILPRSKQREPG